MRAGSFFSIGFILSILFGCQSVVTPVTVKEEAEKDYYRQLLPGEQALYKITDPEEIPSLQAALQDINGLQKVIQHSLHYLEKPSSQAFFPISGISHSQVQASLVAFQNLLKEHEGLSPAQLESIIQEQFDFYTSVGYDRKGGVLFTGYYTPIFDARLKKQGKFRYPLYRLPSNHVKDPYTGETLGRRNASGEVDPFYPSREELLASGELEGLELVWLQDPVEAYVVGVQGSGFLRLSDQRQIEISYAGSNGREYTSIALALLEAGALKREELNLDSLIRYFKQHPEEFPRYANLNERYVFFQESQGGPWGSLNEPVIAGRSIATDKSIFPRAALCLVDLPLDFLSNTDQGRYQAFVCDQDTGGAIRAPGRCDLFMGIGEEAGQKAGRIFSEGRLYYLILK